MIVTENFKFLILQKYEVCTTKNFFSLHNQI